MLLHQWMRDEGCCILLLVLPQMSVKQVRQRWSVAFVMDQLVTAFDSPVDVLLTAGACLSLPTEHAIGIQVKGVC